MTPATIVARLRERDLLDVARDCARPWHMTVEDMFARRNGPGRRARAALWAYLLAVGWSSNDVGKLCGFDHSTVLQAVKWYGQGGP
jgi:hypothetical protein